MSHFPDDEAKFLPPSAQNASPDSEPCEGKSAKTSENDLKNEKKDASSEENKKNAENRETEKPKITFRRLTGPISVVAPPPPQKRISTAEEIVQELTPPGSFPPPSRPATFFPSEFFANRPANEISPEIPEKPILADDILDEIRHTLEQHPKIIHISKSAPEEKTPEIIPEAISEIPSETTLVSPEEITETVQELPPLEIPPLEIPEVIIPEVIIPDLPPEIMSKPIFVEFPEDISIHAEKAEEEIPELPEIPETTETAEPAPTEIFPEIPEIPETVEFPEDISVHAEEAEKAEEAEDEIPEVPEIPEIPETAEPAPAEILPEIPETVEFPEDISIHAEEAEKAEEEIPEVPEIPETPETPHIAETPKPEAEPEPEPAAQKPRPDFEKKPKKPFEKPVPAYTESPETGGFLAYVARVGMQIENWVAMLGDFTFFACRVMWWVLRLPRKGTLLPCMYEIGIMSLPVIALTGTFIGMVMAVQSYNQLKGFYLETRMGALINLSLVRELGPVLAATMLAGRIGSSMAAELGTMRVTEQIDAMGSMGVNPIHYLVVPRFLGCVMLIPMLTIVADFMGIVGGVYFSVWVYGVDWHFYLQNSNKIVGSFDIFIGVFKSIFFGAVIGLIGCHRGFHSRAGAEGVGKAATEAFVISFVVILLLDLALGIALESFYQTFIATGPKQL